jgi:hypothetical protein
MEEDLGESSTCDTCSMLFDPLPGPHYPGNMWVARCSYIAKLQPLTTYQQRHQAVDSWIQDQTDKNVFVKDDSIFEFRSNTVGRDRYDAEHWLGGHQQRQ